MLGQVQALMSLLEGHGNVVMDDLGREHVAGQERMARVLSQRRKIGGITGALHKMLGIEQKMRQYEVGEQFVRGVYEIGGRRAIDAVWQSPQNLPTTAELHEPARWLARVDALPRVSPLRGLDDLAPGGRVVVGCSGGADSLALLALACDVRPRRPRGLRRPRPARGHRSRRRGRRSCGGAVRRDRARRARRHRRGSEPRSPGA